MAVAVQTRRKMLSALDRGESAASIARRFEVHERTVRRLRDRVAAGKPVEPDRTGAKGYVKLTDADLATLRREVRANPGVTLRELCGKLGVRVVESTVSRALHKLRLSFKKSP